MTDKQKSNNILLNHHACEYSSQQGDEAYNNLCGFMSLLVKINEREKLVPMEADRGQAHES